MDKKKKKNEEESFFVEHKKELIGGVIGIIIGVLLTLIIMPTTVAKLKDGREVVVELKGKKITAEDLYSELKNNNGINTLIETIDTYILHDKYDIEKEAKEYAESQSKQIFSTYETYYGYSKEEFITMNGFESEQAFLDYLSNEYYYQKYYDEYVGQHLTDEEVDKYYKENVFGNKHIYLFTSQDDKKTLKEVKEALEDGKSLEKIKDKFSKITASDLESVKYTDTNAYSEKILKKVASTKKGKASSVFEEDTYGYALIYVVDEEKKPEFKDVKDEIVSALVASKQQEDENLYYKAFIELRKEYKIKFYDKALEKTYNQTIKDYK